MRRDTILVFEVETVPFEVEVKVPQVSMRVGFRHSYSYIRHCGRHNVSRLKVMEINTISKR